MRKSFARALFLCSVGIAVGCESPSSVYRGRLASYAPDTGHHDLWDAVFRRRHPDLKGPVSGDPMLEIAREVTMLEDDIRRDGSITIKKPDVWGDGNLVASIQEYETLMIPGEDVASFDRRFTETVQAYIARSDQGEFQSTTAIGQSLSGAPTATLPGLLSSTQVAPTQFQLINNPVGPGVASSNKGIGLEPTELDRQRSTFLKANQSLRRKMIGDDNSRAAGYGLYLFRIPVSVIPGRETTEGYSAIATLRAQLQVDQNHLRNTFPKMVVADLVESVAPRVLANWEEGKTQRNTIKKLRDQIQKEEKAEMISDRFMRTSSFRKRIDYLNEILNPSSTKQTRPNIQAESALGGSKTPVPFIVPFTSQSDLFSDDVIDTVVDLALEQFGTQPTALVEDPTKADEIRQFLFGLLEQTHNVLQENEVYESNALTIADAGDAFSKGQYDLVATHRDSWFGSVSRYTLNPSFESASWLLALQSGIFDRNLKKILRDLEAKGLVAAEHCGDYQNVLFFAPNCPEAVQLWEMIVRQSFPLHVFNLDPIVEEQNAYDAFSRRREMQVALAFSVAKGSALTAEQKLMMSRKLALDEATIALNRTAVAFAQGDDTFGWYFHPRVQTPPTESSNLGALARTIWSTGPTEHYDRKHHRLEPGIRECEVLIAMPSFVTEVSFDVTTNWEKIARPGVTKRSYEEMLAQGGRIHRLRHCMQEPNNQHCYRPGDLSRLSSRIDQLEGMLGMQTYEVSLPYQYDQTGTGLFDNGRKQLRPVVDYYYGLTYLDPDQSTADFFITGKNFHPTLTHVIVGGSETHSSGGKPTVEVINRELIKVTVGNLHAPLSKDDRFEIRVATPAGMSNPLVINKKPSETADATARAIAELALPRLVLDAVDPILFRGIVELNGVSAIQLHTSSRGQKFNLVIDDANHKNVSVMAAKQPKFATIFVAIADPSTKQLVADPVALTLDESGNPITSLFDTRGKINILSDDVATSLNASLMKISQSTPLNSKTDRLDLEIAVYYVLNPQDLPRQVKGTAKVVIERLAK